MKKSNEGEHTSAREDLLSALERLKHNQPTKADLILRASQGKLKINPNTVAKEAGRSRTLIGMPSCALPDVRAKVLEAEVDSGVYKLRAKAIKDAKTQIDQLKDQLQLSNTALASAVVRIHFLEARLAAYETVDNVTRIQRKGKSAGRDAWKNDL